MVEFALVLPLLLLLLLAVVDFGRAFNYWNDETHLANEGARWAAVNANPGAPLSLANYIKQSADTKELKDGAQVCISFPGQAAGASAKVGDPVQIQVHTTYSFLSFLQSQVKALGTKSLDATSVMRLEQVPTNFPGSGTTCSS
jgi:Flp pilus assembly protein TadG